MNYMSVCSGIEAATVAWHPLGWQPVAFSEIEKFPSQVLAHHYPDVPNLGDMTKFQEWPNYANLDVLVGGTPCQSFSVAGLRKGLADPRGNLMLTYLAIAARYRPRWLVWENVPGVLSSNGGRDFGTFLGALGELGYGFAYRVLDAEYFGVAQRRRRVFVVGHLGDWRRAAAVLFERESMSGNPAPRREAREDPAKCLTRGVGQRFDSETETMIPTYGIPGNWIGRKPENGGIGGDEHVSPTLSAADSGSNRTPVVMLGDTLYNKGIKQGDNHASAQETNARNLLSRVQKEIGEKAFAEWGLGILDSLQTTKILQSALHELELRPAAFTRSWVVYCALSREENRASGAMQSLREAIGDRCPSQGWQLLEQLAGQLGAYLSKLSQPGPQPQRFLCDLRESDEGSGLLRKALSKIQEVGRPNDGEGKPTHAGMQVRRLTPLCCEFLQGFPRGYTDIRPNGKDTPDGPRYKALGNSMAVPVMRWIGERIAMVDAL
jgi:DNA (cytosine-5)-methyltransferase 1